MASMYFAPVRETALEQEIAASARNDTAAAGEADRVKENC